MRGYDAQGKPVYLPEGEAAAAYLRGEITLDPGAKIPVKRQDGRVGTVPAEALRDAVSSGYSISTDAALQRAGREEQYGTGAEIAKTAAEGVARGLSLGLYDAAASELGGYQTREAIEARQEVNPGTAITGEVVGAAAPVLLAGPAGGAGLAGETALGRAAGAVGFLPRLAARGGLAAERATMGALGEGTTAFGRIGRTALAGAVGGAVESAPSALGHALSTAAMRDDATAERVLAQIGLETLAGGLAGGILSGAGKSASEGYQAAASRVFGESTHPGLGEALVRASAAMSGADPAALRALSTREGRAVAFYEHPKIVERVGEELTASLDNATSAIERASSAFRGEAKLAQVAKSLPDSNVAEQLASHQAALADVRQTVDSMLADRSLPWRSQLREVRDAIGEVGDDPAAAFVAVDAAKRRMQQTTRALSTAYRRTDNAAVVTRGQDVLDRLAASQDKLRLHLEDEATFGAAGTAQKEINNAWGGMLSAQRQLEKGGGLFQRVETGLGKTSTKADQASVSRYLDGLLDPKKDASHQALAEWLRHGDAFVESVAKHGGDDALKTAAAQYRKAAEGVRKGLAEASDAVVLGNQAKMLSQQQGLFGGDGGGNVIGAGASFALDSLAPLGIGAALGVAKKAVNALTAPGHALKQVAAIERLAGQATARLKGTLDNFLAGAKKAGNAAKPGARTATIATARASYRRVKDRLANAQSDPEGARAAVARSMGPVRSPEATEAMQRRVDGANAFLASKLPRSQQVTAWRQREPSASELSVFARYVAATEDPIGTLTRELGSGALTHETMATIRELYPTLAREITERVQTHVAEAKEAPSYSQLVQMSLLLGVPLSESLTPESIALSQSAYEYSDTGAPSPGKPVPGGSAARKIASAYETSTTRLAAGRI